MTTTNKLPLDQQVKAFKQSSSFTAGDALSFGIKFNDTVSLPGRHDPAAYITSHDIPMVGNIAIVCPGNGGLCAEALRRGAANVAAFEPRDVYRKSIAKVAEFCEALGGKRFDYKISREVAPPDTFDTIVWSEGLDDIRDPAEFFKGVVKSLRPGGTLVIEVSHGTHAPLPKTTNAWRPSLESFESTIKAFGNLAIVIKKPGRNQLRVVYKIKNTAAPAQTQTVLAPAPLAAAAALPEEQVIATGSDAAEEEMTMIYDNDAATPKRRSRKPKP